MIYDIGLFVNRTNKLDFTFNDEIKEKLLRRTWVPESFNDLYVQVLSNVNRHFQKT